MKYDIDNWHLVERFLIERYEEEQGHVPYAIRTLIDRINDCRGYAVRMNYDEWREVYTLPDDKIRVSHTRQNELKFD